MANQKYIKQRGMGGSRNGRGRSEPTEILKKESKKVRRVADKSITQKELSYV